ncbi:LCP family protein required for cell wall assembly [Nakamurella sp. UYEF19]|uniref:LCP family protein n=1 Tax=Nakamurella sp. UYEF19 TaxID=1756392 RepID=UPI00339272B1
MSDEPRDGASDGADHGQDGSTGQPAGGISPETTQSPDSPAHGLDPPQSTPRDAAAREASAREASARDVSAPWERPRRWNQQSLDATRVDDLLARLGSDDTPPENRRRRRAADDAVPASDLIAALSASDEVPPTPPASGPGARPAAAPPSPAVTAPTAVNPPSTITAPSTITPAPEAIPSPAAISKAPAASPTAPAEIPTAPARTGPSDDRTEFLAAGWNTADQDNGEDSDHTVLLPPRVGPGERPPIRDLSDANSRTDYIPKITGSAADLAEADSIRAALHRQSALDSGAVPAAYAPSGPPPGRHTPRASSSAQPPRRRRGLLYAGRTIAALVAFVTLLGVGVEWKVMDRADTSIIKNRVQALNTQDTHISTARTAPVVTTNSRGVKVTESAKAPTAYQPENILLLGSDTRAGGNAALGGTDASTADSANSDTLMIAHISGDRQHVTILSIPRDTIVTTPACRAWSLKTGKFVEDTPSVHGGTYSHINTLYGVGGPTCTVAGVQSLTGIGISRYIGIDFQGFSAMVDALNGVSINICAPIIDSELGTVADAAGVHIVMGGEALSLVRARHVQGDTGSDLARIRRQQIVLSAILRQVTQAGTLLNPAKLDAFLQAFAKNTFTENVSLTSLATLAGSLGSLDPAHVTFYTMPTVNSTKIDGALDPDTSKTPAVFDALINDLPLPGEQAAATPKPSATPVTPAPSTTAPSLKLTVDPSKVALEIYNVTGQANVATTAQEKLNAVGFKVTDAQLFKLDTDTQTGTTVLYAPANRAAALTVAAAVPGSSLVVTPGLGTTVRLRLGSSYSGTISAVTLGRQAPASLATAVSTGPSVAPTASTPATTLGSTDLTSVNAAAGTCA